MIRRGYSVSGLAAVTLLRAMAPAVFAQGSDWDAPAGFTPKGQPNQSPSRALQGPIMFDEPEFPPGTMANGHIVNTIGGAPLPAPLTFTFSSADAAFGLVGPVMTA